MRVKQRTVSVMATTTMLLGAVGAAAPAAIAKGGDATIKTGSCSGTADWKLKAKHDNGRIEVEFEVDSNRVGQTWHVRLKDNGDRFFRGARVTKAPSGSFTVRRNTDNRVGSDRIVGRAVHGDQVCRGVVTV
jgi:hypothetical protein